MSDNLTPYKLEDRTKEQLIESIVGLREFMDKDKQEINRILADNFYLRSIIRFELGRREDQKFESCERMMRSLSAQPPYVPLLAELICAVERMCSAWRGLRRAEKPDLAKAEVSNAKINLMKAHSKLLEACHGNNL